jgi:hypothetical protein
MFIVKNKNITFFYSILIIKIFRKINGYILHLSNDTNRIDGNSAKKKKELTPIEIRRKKN